MVASFDDGDQTPAWPQNDGMPEEMRMRCALRQRLSDRDWNAIVAALPKKTATRAQHFPRTRQFVEAALWVADTGLQWRRLPAEFGSWRANYVHFLRWAQQGTWHKVIAAVQEANPRAQLQHLVGGYVHEGAAGGGAD